MQIFIAFFAINDAINADCVSSPVLWPLSRLGVQLGESAPAVRNEMSRKSLPRITRRRLQEFFYI